MVVPSASDLCKGIQIVHRWKLYIYTVLFLRVLFDAKCAIRNRIVHYSDHRSLVISVNCVSNVFAVTHLFVSDLWVFNNYWK